MREDEEKNIDSRRRRRSLEVEDDGRVVRLFTDDIMDY